MTSGFRIKYNYLDNFLLALATFILILLSLLLVILVFFLKCIDQIWTVEIVFWLPCVFRAITQNKQQIKLNRKFTRALIILAIEQPKKVLPRQGYKYNISQ